MRRSGKSYNRCSNTPRHRMGDSTGSDTADKGRLYLAPKGLARPCGVTHEVP